MTASAAAPAVSHARWAELDAETAYAILQLRTLVFVVEQRCVYQDLDGRDLEETALQLWISDAGRVVSAARLLVEPGGAHRIGKVATHPDHRRRGFARALVTRALQLAGGEVVLNAQVQLTRWYQGFGFEVSGDQWDDQGIPHIPMRLVR